MRGFKLFGRTNRPRHRIISWHSPHSLTWRWSLWIGFERPRLKPYFAPYRKPCGLLDWNAHFFGLQVSFNQQRPMWFRDMYQRQNDRINQLDGNLILSKGQPNRVERMKPVAWMRRAPETSTEWLAGIPEVAAGNDSPGPDWTPLYFKPDLQG
ncbi:hypothetical protein [Bauldia litoralis]|uniref:hypothetical protein n=1 Tax=Bauldia litoralis TaxID=665467 RepID=UPI00326347AA